MVNNESLMMEMVIYHQWSVGKWFNMEILLSGKPDKNRAQHTALMSK